MLSRRIVAGDSLLAYFASGVSLKLTASFGAGTGVTSHVMIEMFAEVLPAPFRRCACLGLYVGMSTASAFPLT